MAIIIAKCFDDKPFPGSAVLGFDLIVGSSLCAKKPLIIITIKFAKAFAVAFTETH